VYYVVGCRGVTGLGKDDLLAMERGLFSRRAGQARSTGAQLPPNEDPNRSS
jgi:hypothetical protein